MEKEEDIMPKWAIGLICFAGVSAVFTTASLVKSCSKRKDREQKAELENKYQKQKASN